MAKNHTMKHILSTLITIVFSVTVANAQTPIKFHYRVKPDINKKGALYEKSKDPAGNTVYKRREIKEKIKVGKVKINESHDTLTLVPWYNTNGATKLKVYDDTSDVPLNDNSEYFLVIDWPKNKICKYFILPLGYRHGQFAVTSLPFRISLKTGELENNFLNANLTYLFMFGKTRFYKSKFLDPRNNYWGIGPYIGASTIKDGTTEYFGFNYGLNGIRSIKNIDLTLAIGAESSFKTKATDFNPYIALGIGIKLIDVYTPDNKG